MLRRIIASINDVLGIDMMPRRKFWFAAAALVVVIWTLALLQTSEAMPL